MTLLVSSTTTYAQSSTSSNFEVYPETQSIIDKAMEENIIDENFLSQFNTLFEYTNDFTSSEYNELLAE